MTAELVDVPAGQTPGVAINFGTLPGFALSQHGNQAALDAFGVTIQNATTRFVSYSTGAADYGSEFTALTNWADTGLTTHPYFDGGSRFASFTSALDSFERFNGNLNGSFAAPGNYGGAGLDCFDAAPTSGAKYSALYLGNQCDTFMGEFRIGALPIAPTFDTHSGTNTTPRLITTNLNDAAGVTRSVALRPVVGELNIVAIVRASAVNDLPVVSGWTQVPVPPDGPGPQATTMTLYWRIYQRGDPDHFFITWPSAFRGGLFTHSYAGVDPLMPVENVVTGYVDGTASNVIPATSIHPNSVAVSFLAKEYNNGGAFFSTVPSGWTNRCDFTAVANSGADQWVLYVAEKTLATAGSSSLNGSWTPGAGSSFLGFGAAVTLILRAGPGLNVAATSGNVSFTGSSFQPDFVMFFLCDPKSVNGGDGTSWMYGAADASLNQWCAMSRSVYLSGESAVGGLHNQVQRRCRFYNDACIGHIGADGFAEPTTHDLKASLVSMDTNGFTLNISTMTDAIADVLFIAVRAHPGQGHFRVGNGVARTGTGTTAVSGLGFSPEAVIVGSAQTVDGAIQTNFGSAVFGMTDGLTQRSFWNQGKTGAVGAEAPNYPRQWIGNQMLTYADAVAATISSQAVLQSLDPDGFTLNWTTTDANAYRYGWVALQVGEDLSGEPTPITDPVTALFCPNGPTLPSSCATFHGRLTPNSTPPDIVSYFWQYGFPPQPVDTYATTPTLPDGSGTSQVAVTYRYCTSDPAQNFCNPFCYRLAAITSDGCVVYGETICTGGNTAPMLTFNNKFRLEQ